MEYQIIAELEGHSSAVYALHFKENDNTLYSAGGDGMLGAWDLESGGPKPFSIKADAAVLSILHDAERKLFLIGQAEGGIHVIDLEGKRELRHLKYHRFGVFQLLFHPQEPILLSLGGDGALCVIDSESYALHMSIPLSHTKLRVGRTDASGVYLIVGGSDGYIRTLETQYYNELESGLAHEGGVYAMEWVDRETLLTGGRDGHLRFWKFTRGRLTQESAIPAHNFAIYDIAMHPGGKYFATASRDKNIKIWPFEDLQHPLRITRTGKVGHTHSVNRVVWTGDGSVLASAGDDKKIRLWEIFF